MSGTVAASPAAGFSSAPLTDAEKADIRRLCGYPPMGTGNTQFESWRFFQVYGLLEYRMTNLAQAEVQNVRWQLSLLYPIEQALAGMYAQLQVASAAAFTRNPREYADRMAQFGGERRKLCGMLGIPAGPQLRAGSGGRRFVL